MSCPSAFHFARLISAGSCPLSSHSAALKLGFTGNVSVATALVDGYCKSKRIADAQNLFDEMPQRNVVAWNCLIRGYALNGSPQTSMRIFREMVTAGVSPTPFTVSAALLAGEPTGAVIHGVAVKRGFCDNLFVASSLVDAYAKYSSICDARKLFDEMPERNTITYTALAIGYAAWGKQDEAMGLLGEMRRVGSAPNEVTLSGLIAAFSRTGAAVDGARVHCLAVRLGVEVDPFISSALISFYARHGGAADFARAAGTSLSGDQVLLNSVISGNAALGEFREALKDFIGMKRRAMAADFYSLGSLVWAAGVGTAAEEGKQIHAVAVKTGVNAGVFVKNGLVAMYARCGEMGDSEKAFADVAEPDRVSWNSLLSGYAMNGRGGRAIELFETMLARGVEPDRTTLLSMISACGHAGMVEEGAKLFSTSAKGAEKDHYSAIIDLLARAGHLEEAERFLRAEPSASAFRALASAAKSHGHTAMAARAAARLLELCPRDTSSFVLASNLLAEMDFWEDSASVRKKMAEGGLTKEPGRSWIE